MTAFWRTIILALAGLGAAWAVTRVGDGPPTVFNSLDDTAPSAESAPSADAKAPTEEDVATQIQRAEEALGNRVSPNEELPVDPLRADVAIALPSDI